MGVSVTEIGPEPQKGSSPKLVPFYYRELKNCANRGFLHQQAFELAAAVQV